LGYFDDVTTETPAVPGSADQVDVDVAVKEKPAGNLMAGVGYSQSQGILLNASINQNNFLGTGKRVSLAVNTSQATRLYQIAYLNPYYTIDGISRGFEASFRQTDFEELIGASYTTDVGILGVNFGLPISSTSRAGLGLRYQYTNFTAGTSQLAQDFVEANGTSFNDFILSLNYSNDTRDKAVFPTRGTLQGVRTEIAVPGSDLQYYKLGYTGTHYVPLTKRFVLSVSGDLGYGDGYGDLNYLPFFENYYAGGPRSVRGYRASSLGPRETDVTNNPVGGNVKLVGSIEIFAPPPVGGELEKTLRLGVFLDAGNVWITQSTDLVAPTGFSASELRYTTGASATWLSPVGAISISLGYPLNEKEGDDTQMFQFGIGQTF
jgi:outer membrane protein insertion porin family